MANYYHAWVFGKRKHEGQLDDSGRDYFERHCINVSDILRKVTSNPDIIIAGLLHDTLEDTDTTYEELEKEFGETVANLVCEVTHEGEKDEYGYYFPRLNSKDAILIKFADRLSNLSRMVPWSDARQGQYLKKSKFWKDGSDIVESAHSGEKT